MQLPSRALWAGALFPFALLSGGCELMIAGPRAQASDRWEKTYAVNPGARLEIENTNGAIQVSTHEAPSFQVVAHRTARAVSEQGARELLERTRLEAGATADLVRLVTPRSQGFTKGQQVDVRYEILVPSSASVTLTTVNGRVEVTGVAGAVALETVNGGIDARAIPTLTKAETVNGSVRLELAGLPGPGARIETVNGSVSVSLPSRAAADVSVRTVNGAITVDGFSQLQEGERRRRHFEGKVNGGGPTLRVETVNGGVTINGGAAPATATAADAESR
ncbi:hypothetical protein TBR22_A20660 [Luteitalea sp. TBR-22]|uniref:DUF4097 family beta strand repeat-containing protein n=1 Tax=Luteitalea sp. TBR-22 TaxID=2802971 RepID=UPI001AF78B23|nr:DUF4097 family beta strand repeat-containing protein [Luteitalea sp. TBR-22]BCS32843.1 hypothetical protein TBR22_A20660 [Luteitalea sp. TBR-22]